MRRSKYIEEIRYWMGIYDRRWWNEKDGLYEGLWIGNVFLLPALAVLGLEGDAASVRKIVRIMEKMNRTPPWDDVYHYYNSRFDQLGAAPHPGSTIFGVPLAAVAKHARELDLPRELVSGIVDKLQKMCAKWARYADRARASPYPIGTDREGKEVDTTARRAEFVRKGLPEDLRWMEEAGPDGQSACLRPCAQSYLATGDERFWRYTEKLWQRVIDRVENGRPHPFGVCFDPDFSWIYYWAKPSSRYEAAVYNFSPRSQHLRLGAE